MVDSPIVAARFDAVTMSVSRARCSATTAVVIFVVLAMGSRASAFLAKSTLPVRISTRNAARAMMGAPEKARRVFAGVSGRGGGGGGGLGVGEGPAVTATVPAGWGAASCRRAAVFQSWALS